MEAISYSDATATPPTAFKRWMKTTGLSFKEASIKLRVTERAVRYLADGKNRPTVPTRTLMAIILRGDELPPPYPED